MFFLLSNISTVDKIPIRRNIKCRNVEYLPFDFSFVDCEIPESIHSEMFLSL